MPNRPAQNRSAQNRSAQNRPGQNRPAQNRPAQNQPVDRRPAQVRSAGAPVPSFAELGLPPVLCAALTDRGITTPFPIQAATLIDVLAGRDVLGRGRTGSGKTLAFGLPTLARLAQTASTTPRRSRAPRALVLVPTRELATQIHEALDGMGRLLGLTSTTIFGGVGQGRQVTALRAGIDLLVACPGRLEDLISQGECRLDAVEITILDEADHMADLGFLPAVRRLLDRTPAGTQRLLFSATLDGGIDVLVKRYLRDAVTHSVDPVVAPVTAMDHHVFAVAAGDKPAVVRELASGTGRSLLFTRTKHSAKKLAKQLTAAGVPAVDLHGNLSQGARERNLSAFSSGEVQVLVATDIAARGIHVDEIELVVHVDPPAESKAYLHRSGRTARAGAAGTVVTLMLPEQRADMRTLARQAGISPTTTTVEPGSHHIRALTGPPAALRVPAPPAGPTPSRPSGAPVGTAGRRRRGRGARPGVSA